MTEKICWTVLSHSGRVENPWKESLVPTLMLGICCMHITAWDTTREGKLGPCPPALIIGEGKMHAFGETGRGLDPE